MAVQGSTCHAVELPTYSVQLVSNPWSHVLVIRGKMAAMEVARFCARRYRNACFSVNRIRKTYGLHGNYFVSVRLSTSRRLTNTSNSRRGGVRMYGLLGISMGALVGAGYAYYKKTQERSSTPLNENMGITSPVLETAPSFQISREVFLY
jgi:hypothetical protein